jgi:hypothetical protein
VMGFARSAASDLQASSASENILAWRTIL